MNGRISGGVLLPFLLGMSLGNLGRHLMVGVINGIGVELTNPFELLIHEWPNN